MPSDITELPRDLTTKDKIKVQGVFTPPGRVFSSGLSTNSMHRSQNITHTPMVIERSWC